MSGLASRIVSAALLSKFGNPDFFNFDPDGQIHLNPELGTIHNEDVYRCVVVDFCLALIFLPFNVLLWPFRFVTLCCLRCGVDTKLYQTREHAYQSDFRLIFAWLGSIFACVHIYRFGLLPLDSKGLSRVEVLLPFLSFFGFCSVEVIRKQRRSLTFYVNHMRRETCLKHSHGDPLIIGTNSDEDASMKVEVGSTVTAAKDFCTEGENKRTIKTGMHGIVVDPFPRQATLDPFLVRFIGDESVQRVSQDAMHYNMKASKTNFMHADVHIDARVLVSLGAAAKNPALEELEPGTLMQKLHRRCWRDVRFHVGGTSEAFGKYLAGMEISWSKTFEKVEHGLEEIEHKQREEEIENKQREVLEELRSKIPEKLEKLESWANAASSSSPPNASDPENGEKGALLPCSTPEHDITLNIRVKQVIDTFHTRVNALNYIEKIAIEQPTTPSTVKVSFVVVEMMLCLAYPEHFRPERNLTTLRNIAGCQGCDSWRLLLAAVSLVHAAIPRLWMWWQTRDGSASPLWPCEDVLSNAIIYTSMACNCHAHWVMACFLYDAYRRMDEANECLTILQRLVRDAPNFKTMLSYNEIVDRSYSKDTSVGKHEVHIPQHVSKRWTCGSNGKGNEFKPLLQFALNRAQEVNLWWQLRKSYIIFFSNDRIYLELYMGLLVCISGGISVFLGSLYFVYEHFVLSTVLLVWDLAEIVACMMMFLTVCIKTNDLLSYDGTRLLAIRHKMHEVHPALYNDPERAVVVSLLSSLIEVIDKKTDSVKVFGMSVDPTLRAQIVSALFTGLSFGIGALKKEKNT